MACVVRFLCIQIYTARGTWAPLMNLRMFTRKKMFVITASVRLVIIFQFFLNCIVSRGKFGSLSPLKHHIICKARINHVICKLQTSEVVCFNKYLCTWQYFKTDTSRVVRQLPNASVSVHTTVTDAVASPMPDL